MTSYSSTATLHINDHAGLFELAKMHRDRGVFDVSCAVTGEEKAVYRSFFKLDFGWSTNQIKAAIVKLKAN